MAQRLKLSSYSLNLFLDCPRCFWLDLNAGLKRPQGPMASIATGLDSKIKAYFNTYRAKGVLPPIIEGKVLGKLVEKLPSSLSFFDKDAGVTFWGKLDECVVANNRYAPLDHKTRASTTETVHPAYLTQMNAYALLLQKNGFDLLGKAYLVYYVPKEGELHLGFPFEVDVKEVDVYPEHCQKILSAASELLKRPEPPEANPACIFCHWAEELKSGRYLI